MPSKTIYVSQDDVSVFDAAKAKAGNNLSSVIANALREYTGRQDSKEKGFSEVTVILGNPGYQHEKRFMGKRILTGYDGFSKGIVVSQDRYKGYTIYETPKGQYAVVSCSLPDPFAVHTGVSDQLNQAIVLEDDPDAGNKAIETLMGYADGEYADFAYDYKLDVCSKLEDTVKVLPEQTYKNLLDKLEQIKAPVEYLDI